MLEKSAHLPVNHRYFGSQFQLWRHDAGISREELAEAVQYSAELIKSVEQGRRRVPPRVAEIADEMFGARGKLAAGLSYLTKESLPLRAHDLMQRESETVLHSSYETVLIPGLLQTEPYARALLSGTWPPVEQDLANERLAIRLSRQALLTRKPLIPFTFVVFEAALRSPVGGNAVQKDQLLHLLEAGRRCNVALQVLPFERVTSSALSGALLILESEDHERTAFVMGQSTSRLVTERPEVSALEQRYGRICSQALDPDDSARFIERIAEEL
ncbi:helix-turn-helix transcriptional regulator [Streptomyces sp. NPDC026206]|uniref:helix-turn-helix domain-containing protein n=1 Tax=Streptomyces sp. NPDC026206 TaxID=3157089 RepID=UPI0033F95F89